MIRERTFARARVRELAREAERAQVFQDELDRLDGEALKQGAAVREAIAMVRNFARENPRKA